MTEELQIGVLGGPVGLDGALKIKLFSDKREHLKKIKSVALKKSGSLVCQMNVAKFKLSEFKDLLYLEGINTPESAKQYSALEVWVDRALASPLKEGEVYLSDLVGLDVVYNGKSVGKVTSYYEASQAPLLEVQKEISGKKYMVPYISQYLGKVDLKMGNIELLNIELLS